MSNVAGKAYGMNVVTPMRPSMTWLNTLLFMASRALPGTLSGLLGLSLIHFARWVMIRRDQWPERGQGQQALKNDYMLFCSNFNGTWDQYIDAFADGIPGGLDLFWYSSTKYPNSVPVTPFKDYIRFNQIDTSYYYNATPGSGQRDIKLALKLYEALCGVNAKADDAALAQAYRQVLEAVQGGLGAPGYAPIASCDTSAADRHRCAAVRARWGAHAQGPPEAVHVIHAIAPQVVATEAPGGKAAAAAVRDAVAEVTLGKARLEAPALQPTQVFPPPVIKAESPPPAARASAASQTPGVSFDGGHYFFTGLVPICNVGIVEHGGLKSSPIHMVREALETLPTALQSHASEEVGIQSPFARSLRTHFARLVVLDQPYFNGRDHADALVSTIKGTDLLAAEPVDALACPYVLVAIDFDPGQTSGRDEPRSYFEELWRLMPVELAAVFRYAYGFSEVVDAASFADMMLDCEVETTMPFNDYWVGAPKLPSLSVWGLAAPPIIGFIAPLLGAWLNYWSWGLGVLLAIVLALVGVVIDYAWVMHQGGKPFPAAPNATLRHVLKALYLQQAFTRFVAAQQGAAPAGLGAAFRQFLAKHDPANLAAPTQPPGVIRSAGPFS
jgi:hypothetical protein